MSKPTRQNFNPDDFITAKASAPKASQELVLYGRDGSEVFDEDQAAAKLVKGRGYFRFSTAGNDAGDPYDPAEYPDATLGEANRIMGHQRYPWKPVTKAAFDHYVEYLQTRNVAQLRVAARNA